jgi:4-amino-4-deoxychorismate lyase
MSALALAVTGRGLIDPHEPAVRADDEALLRGRAAFETLRIYAGRPFALDAHLDRLAGSAETLGLPPVERRRMQVLTGLVLPQAAQGDAVLRLVWTAGPREGPPSGLALLSEIPDWIEEVRKRGASAVSLLGVRAVAPWLLPGVKSTSYAVNMAAEAEARRRGADEAVFVDPDGIVLEGTVTNVWWRHGEVLRTPSLDLGILAGVTRQQVLELAEPCGYRVEEGAFALGDVLDSDEVFTSSSVRELMPVVRLDERRFDQGPAAAVLQQALRERAAKV